MKARGRVVFVPPPSLSDSDVDEMARNWQGAALDSLALNVALSTGVAADKAGVWFQCL